MNSNINTKMVPSEENIYFDIISTTAFGTKYYDFQYRVEEDTIIFKKLKTSEN